MAANTRLGTYAENTTAGERYKVFIPAALPPQPALQLDDTHHDLLEKANRALGRLDGMGTLIPDISLFIYFYVRKEALLFLADRGDAILVFRLAAI